MSTLNLLNEIYDLYETYCHYILESKKLDKRFFKNIFLNSIFPNLYRFEFKDQVSFGSPGDTNSCHNLPTNSNSLNPDNNLGDQVLDQDFEFKTNRFLKSKDKLDDNTNNDNQSINLDNELNSGINNNNDNIDNNDNNNNIQDDSELENLKEDQSEIDKQLNNQDNIQDENKQQGENNLEDTNNLNFNSQENNTFKDQDSESTQSDFTHSNENNENNEDSNKKINPKVQTIIKKIFQKISLKIHPDKIKPSKKKHLDLILFFDFDDVYNFYKQERLSILIYIANKLNISLVNIINFNQIIVDYIIIEMKKTIAEILNNYYLN